MIEFVTHNHPIQAPQKRAPKKTHQPTWTRVAENMVRHTKSRIYYLRIKSKGKQLKRSLGTTDRKLANRRLIEKLSELEQNPSSSPTLPKSTTINDLITHWLPIRTSSLKPKSASRIHIALKGISKIIGQIKVLNLSHTHIDLFTTKRLQNISDSSAKKERDELISLLDYARSCGLAKANLARPDKFKNIRGIAPIRVKKKELKCPTQEEFETLLTAVKTFNNIAPDGVYRPKGKLDPRTEQAAYLLQLLAYSGMRLNEAINVKWKDVEFAGNRPGLRIDGGAQGTKNGLVRRIPLFPKLKALLLEIRSKSQSPDSEIIKIKNARKALETACAKTGIGPYTQHSLRHYFASEAVEKNIDFKTIGDWLGHQDGGQLVASTYAHLRNDHSWRMAEMMG